MIGSGQEAAPIALRAFFARFAAGFAVVAVVADFDQRAEVDAVARLAFVLLKLRADAAKGENGQGRVGAVRRRVWQSLCRICAAAKRGLGSWRFQSVFKHLARWVA